MMEGDKLGHSEVVDKVVDTCSVVVEHINLVGEAQRMDWGTHCTRYCTEAVAGPVVALCSEKEGQQNELSNSDDIHKGPGPNSNETLKFSESDNLLVCYMILIKGLLCRDIAG